MSDPIDSDSLAEPAQVDVPAPPRPGKKSGGTTAATRPTRKAPKRGRRAPSTLRVKVGGHAITMPTSLGSKLTAKDKKKLLALFKRVIKRDKKRAVNKKRAVKKRVAKKR